MATRITLLLLCLSIVPGWTAAAETGPPLGKLALKVALVGDDLTVRPVPKSSFDITRQGDTIRGAIVTTTFGGEATAVLRPGDYRISSHRAVTWESRTFSWSVTFTIAAGATTVLELSNDNADVLGLVQDPTLPPSESALYARCHRSVLKIYSSVGTGSGFLVDARGLVLTNYHVAKSHDYLAVTVDETKKYPAVLLAADAIADVAVLLVNPGAVAGIPPLALAPDEADRPPVAVGDRVFAIGNPLTAATLLTGGVISKIEPGTYASDVNLNPGNSGGPLFDAAGRVIGLTTFRESAIHGSGVAGIVRIHKARTALERAEQAYASQPLPEARLLPLPPRESFPVDELNWIAPRTNCDERGYEQTVGNFVVRLDTPVAAACRGVAAKKAAAAMHRERTKGRAASSPLDAAVETYDWEHVEPVLQVTVTPKVGVTRKSLLSLIFGSETPTESHFKADFARLALERDGIVVEPIWPRKAPLYIDRQAGAQSMIDATFVGVYEYAPDAIRAGAAIRVTIWDESEAAPVTALLSPALVARASNDFKPYFEALARQAEARASAPKTHPIVLLLQDRGRWLTAREIADELELTPEDAEQMLSSLSAKGKVLRRANAGVDDVYGAP